MSALAVTFGLIGARIPNMSGAEPFFSWAGLISGFGLVIAAFLLSRLFARGAAMPKHSSPAQRIFLNAAVVSFLLSLFLFVVVLYVPWGWPRVLLVVSVICGACSVFGGIVATLLDKGRERV